MQKTYISLLLLFSTVSLLMSQATISGNIYTEAGAPAEFVNVLLRQSVDSVLVKLELSDEKGRFAFAKIEPGDYVLHVTGLGYAETYTTPFTLSEADYTYPDIELVAQATTLDAVEVIAKKPFLEQRAGKLIVNVDQSITGNGGSVTDLLKKVPGMVVINDRISMAGRSGVTILIDGRPTNYMDIQSLLREMPADNIDRIEVITQPGAAFDAAGTGGVINIVMKKNALLGTNGTAQLGVGYGELWKYRSSVSLSHRNGPLNVNGSVGYSHRTWVERLDITRRLPDATFEQEGYEPGLPHTVWGRAGITYDLSAQHKMGVSGTAQRSKHDRTQESSTRIFNGEGTLVQDFITFNEQDRSWTSLNATGFYEYQIDTAGQKLGLDMNAASFDRNALSIQRTVGADYKSRSNNEPATTRILATKLDYEKPFSENLTFTAGTKYSIARLDNELDATILNGNEWVDDSGRSNRFQYSENIAAAYANLAWQNGEWEANVGLRFEDTQTEGYNVTIDSTQCRDFSQLFPSLSVNTPFIGPLGTSLAYSYRIERPSYYSLNPFVAYIDPFTFQKGNPFLRPELTHSLQLSLTFDKQPFFNLSFDRTTDAITFVTEQDNATGQAFGTEVNLDRYDRIGGSLFFPLDFIAKPISGYAGAMVFHHIYRSDYLGAEFAQDRTAVTAFMQMNIKLPGDVKGEVSGWYQGPGLDGITRHESMYGVSAGLEKKFFDDKLRVQLSADGIIQKFFQGTIDYQNMDFDILSSWEAPTFDLRLTYRFGNQFLKKNENRRDSASEEKSRARITE